jgi:DNA-binding CsgD family transcriptional regulator
LPGVDVLDHLARLVSCDAVGAVLAGPDGCVVGEVELPRGHSASLDSSGCDGPLELGIRHWTRIPGYAEALRVDGLSDSVGLGFRNGRDQVAQVWLDRRTGEFSARDLLVLRLVAPHLQRLVREAGTPTLPACLTVQERRTLSLVAVGCSNPEIAARMSVATSTVRKHLEHAYRKLGVTNRLAAATAFRGREVPPSDLRERIVRRDEIFA